ncbi:hypothetical protein [Crassaminicella profunda]|uniref:hypothetical protein n=1 Tax=Crassaminicella profunda TaxID=1286698 RepID=UPI001CA688A9|nr:hypothetical protein [Crassaminicella profunda]QZY53789.1 hypothetical protein K7H06_12040 [Crassaminicella profunda]
MRNKRFIRVLLTALLAISLFAIPVFATGGEKVFVEHEGNNTKETANSFGCQIPYYDDFRIIGLLNKPTDTHDWYKLTMNISEYSYITMNFFANATPNATYHVELWNQYGTRLCDKTIKGNEKLRHDNLGLVNGNKIYIHVEQIAGITMQPYEIELLVNKKFK